jgi:hypothetical protein
MHMHDRWTPTTQSEVDRVFADWLYAGYPYMGSAEHNRHVLEPDGRIRSMWKNDAGEFQFTEDDVIQSFEEWCESFDAWRYDY